MKSIQILATNPFLIALQRASRPNVISFGDDTVGRFDNANPAGVYTVNLDLLKESITDYKSGVVDAETGVRQEATITVEETQKAFIKTGHQLYSALENGFDVKTSHLLVFFPKGLTGINRANRGDVDTIISSWLKNVVKPPYVSVLKKEWIDRLTELQTNWRAVTGVQSGAKQGVGQGGAAASSFIEPMAQHLWDLLLQVIQNNQPHAENVVGQYFDTTPLDRDQSSDTDGLGRTLGLVTDGTNPLALVHITAKDAAGNILWAGKTGSKGNWRTKSLPVGMYHLTFQKDGYITQIISHEILDDGDTNVDVVMVVG